MKQIKTYNNSQKKCNNFQFLLIFLVVIITVILVGCSITTFGSPPVRLQFLPDLPIASVKTGTRQSKQQQLIVSLPKASNDIDSDGIVMLLHGREVAYLSGYRWVDTGPKLLQHSLVMGLEQSGAFASVTDESAGISASLLLQCDLQQFSLRYSESKKPPTAVIQGIFRIIHFSSGKTLATYPFLFEEQAIDENSLSLTKALEKATSKLFIKVIPWATKTASINVSY